MGAFLLASVLGVDGSRQCATAGHPGGAVVSALAVYLGAKAVVVRTRSRVISVRLTSRATQAGDARPVPGDAATGALDDRSLSRELL